MIDNSIPLSDLVSTMPILGYFPYYLTRSVKAGSDSIYILISLLWTLLPSKILHIYLVDSI